MGTKPDAPPPYPLPGFGVGRGIDAQGWWRECRQDGKFFVHVKQLSKVFRGKFTDGLIKLQNEGIVELESGPLVPGKKYLHPL